MRVKWVFWALAIGGTVGAALALTSSLKRSFEQTLTSACGRAVTIQVARVTFPFGIDLVGIDVPSLPGEMGGSPASIGEVSLRLSFPAALGGKPGMEIELTRPRLVMARDPDGFFSFPVEAIFTTGRQTPGMILSRMRIRDGSLTFIDQAIAPEVICDLRDLRLSVSL
ncbi:MAG: hypothetical protein HYZ90_06950, partial [Candidatus Omnitrophica bacterium]|nr:hypothetical protein [Candidatus Omnitrophota bacterium]